MFAGRPEPVSLPLGSLPITEIFQKLCQIHPGRAIAGFLRSYPREAVRRRGGEPAGRPLETDCVAALDAERWLADRGNH
jgi:hypothetical protein